MQDKVETNTDITEITIESVTSFLNDNLSKIKHITNEIYKKNNDIVQKMSDIKIYLKDCDKQNKDVYIPLMHEIEDYFKYIQNSVKECPTKNPFLKNVFKYQLYTNIFSLHKSKPLELLFCAQTLDADLLLACARRANHCMKSNIQQDLLICDMNMCRDLIELEVSIKNVFNLGIMHHYIPINLDETLTCSTNNQTFFDEEVKQAVLNVIRFIPEFIKVCLSQTENELKVVLRSCYGVELKEEKNIPELDEIKAYPITIEVVDRKHQDLQVKLNSQQINNRTHREFKGHIVIKQIISDGVNLTKLYLPIAGHGSIQLEGFPTLHNANNFELFAQKLIDFWPELKSNKLHINPYSIHIYPQLSEYKNSHRQMYTLGLKKFKAVFIQTLVEWEEGIKTLKSPKIKYNSLFTTTANLKDVITMPEGSYAALLLDLIKKYPIVAFLKAYYADYRAGPDRTILEMDAKGKNASSPKSLTVSRNTMWGKYKLTNDNNSIDEAGNIKLSPR